MIEDELDLRLMDEPVVFSVSIVGEQTLIPTYEIEKRVLEWYGLGYKDGYDVLCTDIEEPRWAFAFDASDVESMQLLSDLVELLTNYNEPSDDMSDGNKRKWRQSTVVIDELRRVEQ